MSEPFLGEVRIVAFDFAPRGWAFCDGQILPISQNQALYSLLGTTYGGDGRTSFALPDLRSRVPVHFGTASAPGATPITLGARGGEETHTLSAAELPVHNHPLPGAQVAAQPGVGPAAGVFATAAVKPYRSGASPGIPARNVGGGQSHPNLQPFLALNFAIALQGLFPSRN